MWRTDEVAEVAAEALRRRANELRLEQAVRGLDALPEVGLHPILARGFEEAGLGVFPEQPYPGEPERRSRHAERERCDLVLTAKAGARLIDPVAELIERDKAAGTLFDPAFLEARGRPVEANSGGAAHGPGAHSTGVGTPGTAGACAPEDSFWLEIKTVGQFTYTNGVPGPNGAYSSELLSGPAEDAIKLEWDRFIRHAAVLVVLFTEDEGTADHDVGVLMHRLLDREIPVGSPIVRRFGIGDVIGNHVCSVALVPVVKGWGVSG